MSKDSLKFWQPNDATINQNVKGLIGTKMTVIRSDGTRYQGIVGGIDPYIGISIVKSENKDKIAVCLHGPFDPQVRETFLRNERLQLHYHEKYLLFLDMIRKAKETGVLSLGELGSKLEEISGLSPFGSNKSCPFGV
jgi:small nuclear ribonucleoprotein (snRNP)-like protein